MNSGIAPRAPAVLSTNCKRFVYKLSTKREWVYEPARPSGAEPVNNQLSGQRFEITVSTSYIPVTLLGENTRALEILAC